MDRLNIYIRYLYILLIICIPNKNIKASLGEGQYMFNSIIISGTTNINKFQITYKSEFFTHFTINDSEKDSIVLSIPVDKFTADSKLMLSDFLELINAKKHPYIKIIIQDKINTDFFDLNAESKKEILVGVNGKTNSYFCNTELQEAYKDKWYFSGKLIIKLTDFDLEPPEKFLGLVKVKDDVTISFKILFVLEN